MQVKSSYEDLLANLDKFIRKYHTNQLIRGFLITTAIVLSYFLVIALLEGHFCFDRSVRKVLFFSFLGLAGFSLVFLVLKPVLSLFKLGKHLSQADAAKVIGAHFPEVEDKLLNILQLKSSDQQNALIEASIEQKTQSIQLVPFSRAVDFGENRKYLRYAIPPILVLLFLLFAAPSLLKSGTNRLVQNNKEFLAPAPFHFTVSNPSLQVLQYEDFDVEVMVNGDALPDEVFIHIDDLQYRMQKVASDRFRFTFKNVQKSKDFQVVSGKVASDKFNLKVILKPTLAQIAANIDYPAYTKKKDEVVTNSSDLLVPAGTRIDWIFDVLHTESISIVKDTSRHLRQMSNDAYSFSSRYLTSQSSILKLKNDQYSKSDSLLLTVQVIPDEYPAIVANEFVDSNQADVLFFAGNVRDDYGLSRLTFQYRIINKSGQEGQLNSLPISIDAVTSASYEYVFDINSVNLDNGESLSYYFEVFDNDAVNGPKSAKSKIFEYSKLSQEEIDALAEANNQEIKEALDNNRQESEVLQERIKDIREDLLQKKDLDWKTKKDIEKLLQDQKSMNKELQQMQQKLQENIQNQEELTPEMQEKQEKIEDLLDQNKNEELQELMERIDELLQEMEKDEALEMLEEMDELSEQNEVDMERALEMYKKFEVELELTKQIEELQELGEEQEKLGEETQELDNDQEKSKNNEQQKEKQKEINEKFDEIKDKLNEIEEKNEKLKNPLDMPSQEEQSSDIDKKQDESLQDMEQQKNQEAGQKQQEAGQKMQDMASEMQSAMSGSQQEQAMEDMETLRQLLENLLTLSFEQETLIYSFRQTSINTPRYTYLSQSQKNIEDDFQIVEDSLQALSMRVFELETFITDKVAEIHKSLDKTLDELEERAKGQASAYQQKTMTSLNDLALMLDESLQNMQQQMASGQPSAMCNNPKPNPGGQKSKAGQEPEDKLSKGQEKLNEEMQKMLESRQKGKNPGKGSSEDAKKFAQLAAEQAAIRKALEAKQKLQQEKGKGKSEELEKLIDEMDKTETDLVNKRITNEMIRRQQDILTRMLEDEKAERQQQQDEKRQSQVAEQIKPVFPASLEEYLKERQTDITKYQTISPDLKLFYKNLVESYYRELSL